MSESIGVSFDGKGINMSVSFEKGVSTEVEFPQGGGKVDLSGVAQQGDNPKATNTKILEETLKVSDAQEQIDELIAIQLQTIIGE